MARNAKVFIDGEHGTTGLKIRERLATREYIDMLSIPHEERRNDDLRAKLLNKADVAILCLPDDASRQAVAMLEDSGNQKTRVIDTSTAHRTAPNWVFGFAEMTTGQEDAIAAARFVSNPGCYSTGAIALLRPLIDAGVMAPGHPISINAVSGYTGGGKDLIAKMEDTSHEEHIGANHFLYALTMAHKHVPEIVSRVGLKREPIFTPNVGRFAQGMLVNIPLHLDLLITSPDAAQLQEILNRQYNSSKFVTVADYEESRDLARIDAQEMVGSDAMKLYVFGDNAGTQANLVASLDNLGKGASGAAIQNLDIMLAG
ncbi:MAG: N-acetyl-gamma-glutamyl-phosphate reductase [Rhizobiaceae bacterium]